MPESVIHTPPSMLLISVPNPISGQEFFFTIPADHVYLIHSVHCHFAAGSGGLNRATLLQIDDGTDIFLDLPIDSDIAPRASRHYTWASGLEFIKDTATLSSTAPLPPALYLPAGYRIFTNTANLIVGDSYTAIFIYVSPFILPVDRG